MDKDLLEAMTNVVNAIPNAVKTVGKDVESAIQNLNDDAKASHYIRILKAKLTNKTASILLPRMSEFYEGANLSEYKKKELFESIIDKAKKNPSILNSLSGELKSQVSTMMIEAGMSINPLPPRNWKIPPSDRSSSGESEYTSSSVGSDSSNNSGGSGASNSSVKSVLNTLRQLVSRRSDSTGKGSESQEDQKGPTKSSPSCTAGIKKALSSCCSYLYNGFKGMFETEMSTFKQRFKEMELEKAREERRERKAEDEDWKRKGYIREKKPKTERAASDKSLRNSLSPPFNAVGDQLKGMYTTEREIGAYRATYNNQEWHVKRKAVNLGSLKNLVDRASNVPGQAAKMGVKGVGLAGQGMKALGGGAVSVAGTTFGVAKFMATPGDSSSGRTWTERLQGAGRLTEGMRSGYGPISAGRDFAGWVTADNGVQTTGLPSGRGVAKFLARGAFNAASAGASMASRVANADTFYFPGR